MCAKFKVVNYPSQTPYGGRHQAAWCKGNLKGVNGSSPHKVTQEAADACIKIGRPAATGLISQVSAFFHFAFAKLGYLLTMKTCTPQLTIGAALN
jgi:hypothetical protein